MQFAQRNLTLELHVPCREPLDHFMSIANFLNRKFDCHEIEDDEKLNKHVEEALFKSFSNRLTNEFIEKFYSNQISSLQVRYFNYFPLMS